MDEVGATLDVDLLRHWRADDGLSYTECAERLLTETGTRISVPDLVAAMTRAPATFRTDTSAETIPWQVRVTHLKEYPARMLRLLSRRREGAPLSTNEDRRLDDWLARLKSDDAVVAYNPSSENGFYYVEKNDETDGLDGIPIRRQPPSHGR